MNGSDGADWVLKSLRPSRLWVDLTADELRSRFELLRDRGESIMARIRDNLNAQYRRVDTNIPSLSREVVRSESQE
jgi:hypothetical protein